MSVHTGTACRCARSLAVVCGLFASIAAMLLLAQDRCLDGGGRLADEAWSCQAAGGAADSLWALVTPGIVGAAVLFVGIPVCLAVGALARRWLAGRRRAGGKGHAMRHTSIGRTGPRR